MASQMEWSHDFCLFCDRQISGGAYCSQACRVGDLEKAAGGASGPISPMARSSMSSTSSSWSGAHGGHPTNSGLALPPPINFAAYRSSNRAESTPSSPHHHVSPQHVYFHPASHQASHLGSSSIKRGLTPSSSRASLSSLTTSAPTSQGLSDHAASQLRGYSDAFDQVREMKRRMTYA